MTPNTKDQILQNLRRGEQCVGDLADVIGVAPNTVRTHLTHLERENLVRRSGVRRSPGAGKPAYVYQLTPETRTGYSRAYVPVLKTLVDVLAEDMDKDRLCKLMEDVGHRLAPDPVASTASNTERLRMATTILQALGATLTTTRANGNVVVEGAACPLGEVVAAHPLTCRVVQALLTRALGVPVTAECQHTETPACRFVSGAPEDGQT